MFKNADLGIVYWPITLSAPGATGELIERQLHIGYRVLSRDELAERRRETMVRASGAARNLAALGKDEEQILRAIDEDEKTRAADRALLLERVVGWRGSESVELEDFSVDRLAAVLDMEYLFAPIRAGLLEASRGAPAKNSLPGPAGTPAAGQS